MLLCLWGSLGKNTGVGCHSSPMESSRPRDQTHVSCIAGRFFTISATLGSSCGLLATCVCPLPSGVLGNITK